jgi:phospholipid/cholesterol/gamma-HCH transport system substrate-binding protein
MAPAKKGKKAKKGWRPGNATIALVFLVIVILGPYIAFTKHIPFTSYGYEVKATFSNGVNISKNSPVRVAGVEVGKVISAERDGDNTTVTFTVSGPGRPIHDDAFAEIRPRIFLEGNFFIELDPGSPSAPELDSGGTIPVTHTSTAVQLDQILTALQSPVRADLAQVFEGFGKALNEKPSAAEDARQLPEVQGKTGGEAINGIFKYGGAAGRYGAQTTNALLGTQAKDLSKLIAGTSRTFGAFSQNEADLKGLIDNFEIFTGALAQQSGNLEKTISAFAPALKTAKTSLVNLNETLPPLRAYAIALRPAVAELPELINSAEPFLAQARPLLSQSEAGGTARLLAELTPGLAGAAREGNRSAIPQLNRLSTCATRVLIPTSNQTINDQFSTGGPNYREFFYTLTNFAGQGQNFDGNGPYLRVQGGGGGTLVEGENPKEKGEPPNEAPTTSLHNYAFTAEAPKGMQPELTGRAPKKPEVRCNTQPVPDLNAGNGQPAAPDLRAIGTAP